ncbi:hypothetical protein RQP46_005810 [Phenoliferia psychrophenolica]
MASQDPSRGGWRSEVLQGFEVLQAKQQALSRKLGGTPDFGFHRNLRGEMDMLKRDPNYTEERGRHNLGQMEWAWRVSGCPKSGDVM